MKPLLCALLLLVGCARTPPPVLRYVLGAPYERAGVWHYPRESFVQDETGLGAVVGAHGRLTADGEAFDQTALAASHPTLQLPAMARLTNLENGRQVLVRINDRGPESPLRSFGVTQRTAELLGAADPQAIQLRLEVQEAPSRQMAVALREESQVSVATAARDVVKSETLAAPAGVAQEGRVGDARQPPPVAAAPVAAAPIPLRLPEAVTAVAVRPTRLMIDCGSFSRADYADLLRQRLANLGAITTTDYSAPRDRAFIVRIGPLSSIGAADALLERARRAGATDSRIVVE